MTESLSTALRLIRKYQNDPKEKIGQMFIRVALALEEAETPRRDDLAKMLKAWGFWEELSPDLQSELLDCIEHTYGFGGPSRWSGFIKAHGIPECLRQIEEVRRERNGTD